MTAAVLHVDGWAGRVEYPVEIVEETPKWFRVKLLFGTRLGDGREGRIGDVVLVPKSAVTLDEDVKRDSDD